MPITDDLQAALDAASEAREIPGTLSERNGCAPACRVFNLKTEAGRTIGGVDTPDDPLQATRAWLEHAVIGLNLCPFAKAVHAKGQIRWVLSDATEPEALLALLQQELQTLAEADPQQIDTTLIVHPQVLQDFLDFNDFLGAAEACVEAMGLDGELQVASFHPQFQFGDAAPDDIANATNRSPCPTLHLLREDSIDRAVEAFPEAEAIYERNIETLQRLGPEGWQRLTRHWGG